MSIEKDRIHVVREHPGCTKRSREVDMQTMHVQS